MKGKSLILVLILLFVIFFDSTAQNKQVKIWEDKIILPTYLTGAPDKSPVFYTPAEYQGAQRHIYPYPYIGDITTKKEDRSYKAVFIENEYIKICVTPEMGGRMYYAVDKTNNYDIVYHNHVVKPALIGMAGAWTSGGAEWNIPHHHRPTSLLPVDYKIVENADGSKTVWVGEYEKRHQTRWLVGMTLEPGKSYVKTEFRYFNVTPVESTFLFWANTAVHANENYQVIFPPDVEKAVFHAKTEFTNWPIANQIYQGIDFRKGEDISLWKNTKQPTSFFAWDTKQDFVAGIDHGKNAGTMKVGDRHIFLGKKFWNWGPNEVGRSWDKKLTDSDGPYLELMMGAYSDNQPDYSYINPHSNKQGTFYYYGIRNMDNVKEANPDFALNLEKKGNAALIQVNATGEHSNITVKLLSKGNEVYKETIALSPAKPYSKEVVIAKDIVYTDLKVELVSAENQLLMSWQQAPKKNAPHPQIYKDPLNPSEYSANDQLWLTGLRLEQFGNATFDAAKYYAEALKRNPDDVMVNTQLGLSYIKKGMHKEAEKHLRKAKYMVTANHTKPKLAEPLYYLAVALINLDKPQEASELLYQAAWTYEWTSPAYTLLSQLESQRGDLKKALENAKYAIKANPANIDALNLQTMIMRKSGSHKEALTSSTASLELDPLNFNALNEKYLLASQLKTEKSTDELLAELKEKLRNEADNYLETAARYGKAGFYDDALAVLTLATNASDQLKANPLIYYQLGYYSGMAGNKEDATIYFKKASELPVEYIFPYGEASEKALQAAITNNPEDANAYYLLGNVYGNYQPAKAIEAWQIAVKLNDRLDIAYRNLAFAQANYTDYINGAVENIMKAISINSKEPRYFAEADDYMSFAKTSPEKLAAFIKENTTVLENNVNVQTIDIRLSNFFGNYDKSISMLEKLQYRTEEGADFNIHTYWFDAHLLRGIKKMQAKKYEEAEKDFLRSMEFPANLESERNSKIGMALYYLGVSNKLNGNKAKAKSYFTKMAYYTYQTGWGAGEYPEVDFYKGLSNKELGKTAEADKFFNELINTADEQLKPKAQGQYSKSSLNHQGRIKVALHQRKEQNDRLANAYYTKGLGLLGLGQHEQANEMFRETLKLSPTHMGVKMHMSEEWRLSSLNIN